MEALRLTHPAALAASLLYLLGLVIAARSGLRSSLALRLLLVFLSLALAWSVASAFVSPASPPGDLSLLQALGLPVLAALVLLLTDSFLAEVAPVLEQATPPAIAPLPRRLTSWSAASIVLATLALHGPLIRQGTRMDELVGGAQAAGVLILWSLGLGISFGLTWRFARRVAPSVPVVAQNGSRLELSLPYWNFFLLLITLGQGCQFTSWPEPGYFLAASGALLAVYTFTARRLVEAGAALRRLAGFLAFSAVAILSYLVMIITAQWLLRLRPELTLGTYSLLLAVAMVFLANPLLSRFRQRLDDWALGRRGDPTWLLRQYSQSLTNILDLQLLATVAIGSVSELLEIRSGALFLVDCEQPPLGPGCYRLHGVRGIGHPNLASSQLALDSPLAAYFHEVHAPLRQSTLASLPRFNALAASERQWLEALHAEVLVPIYARENWIGLFALGARQAGLAYSDQDLALLGAMADQTAVALENTRLVEGLRRLNSDFRRTVNALDHANRHLERLDRVKSNFISVASHELRTPLTLIAFSTQLLQDQPEVSANAYLQGLVQKISSGTQRLNEIVEGMLDIAKIDSRTLELQAAPLEFSGLLRKLADDLSGSLQERRLSLQLQGLESIPTVLADASAMHKIFLQLLLNAIKYTPDGGEITVRGRLLDLPSSVGLPPASASDPETVTVEIVVSDTGIGIDPRYQELIFTKFYQTGEVSLHSSGKTKFKGSGPGLGLAIARGLVEVYQGKIWVESPGYDETRCPGSRFHVALPLKRVAAPEDALQPLKLQTA